MTYSISITNESAGTSTASDDTCRTSSIPFQSHDKARNRCIFFLESLRLVIIGDNILGVQLCFLKIMFLLSVGLMELNLCLCQENGNLLLWDFF